MPSIPLPGSTFTFSVPLVSQASSHVFQAAATIAVGDFKRSINGGAFANMDNLPAVTPAAGKLVQIVVSASETTAAGEGGTIDIVGSDAAGAEWDDISICLRVGVIAANAAQLSGDAGAADNLELFFDGTGYASAGTINSVSGSVGGVTGLTPATVAAAILATPAYKLATLSGGEIVISPETVVAAYVENLSPTAQQEAANGVNNLAPASTGAAGSIRAKLDAIKLVTDAIDSSAVTVTSTNSAGVLTFTQGVTFAATVSGLTISATWAKLYFTLKESDYDTDDMALLQLVETNPGAGTDGLLYLNSAAIASPITVADGTLTVSQAAGTVAIAITDNAMAALSKASGLVWDIKTKDAAGATVQNATGTASIGRAITQTI